jgi:hypothetical protein
LVSSNKSSMDSKDSIRSMPCIEISKLQTYFCIKITVRSQISVLQSRLNRKAWLEHSLGLARQWLRRYTSKKPTEEKPIFGLLELSFISLSTASTLLRVLLIKKSFSPSKIRSQNTIKLAYHKRQKILSKDVWQWTQNKEWLGRKYTSIHWSWKMSRLNSLSTNQTRCWSKIKFSIRNSSLKLLLRSKFYPKLRLLKKRFTIQIYNTKRDFKWRAKIGLQSTSE